MNDPTLALTPECTIVYPELFEPVTFGNETEPSYKAVFLIPKSEDISQIREACKQAAYRKWGTGVQMSKLRFPVRDGNEKAVDENGNPDRTNFYFDNHFINAKSKFPVSIVNYFNDPISNPEEIYGGCIVRAYISFYGYQYMGNTGIGAGLRAVCKIADGDPLGGGRVNTAEVFKDFIQPKDTFESAPPLGSNDRMMNEGPGMRQDEWGDNEPKQEPPGGINPEDDLPF